MRSLFKPERETYTEEGLTYSDRIRAALKPIIVDAATHGASLRDLHYIITAEASVTTSEYIIRRNMGKL